MQRPDEKKRQLIANTAAKLFATRPFHKVKLDDVASAAGVGKGTLYIYFKSKEDLYFWLIYDAFARVVGQLETRLSAGELPARQSLRVIIAELVKFGFDNPQLFELMRNAGPIIKDDRWGPKRTELTSLIEKTIRHGNRTGEFNDPHPEITALCVPGLLRSVMLFGPKGLDEQNVTSQINRLLENGISAKRPAEKVQRASAKIGNNGKKNHVPATKDHSMRSILFLCMLAALCMTGCVNQHAEIAKYRSILNADIEGEVPPLEPHEQLTMLRALLLANQDNENLMIRGEDFIQAMNDKDRAFSQFLPTISLQPNYTILDNSEAKSTSGGGTGQAVGTFGGFKPIGKTLRRFEAPVVGGGNLFHGFRDVAALESTKWNMEQRRLLMLDAQKTLLLDVAESYYQVLRAEALIEVLKKSLLAQQERVRDAQGKLNAGVGRPLDLAQAEAQVASTRVQMEQAYGDEANARTLLAFLIGAKEVSGPLVDDYAVAANPPDIDELLFNAWSNREDYKAAKAVVEASVYNVNAAIGEYYPSVTLNITGYLFREDFTDASKWNTLLQINLPIFSAGVIEADVRTAWSRLRQAALEESLIRRQIEREVRTQHQNLRTSSNKLRELDAQIKSAAEAYRQAQAETKAGTGIFLNEITAQAVLLNSELDLANEIFNRKVIDLDLRRATGTLRLGNMQRAATRPTTGPAATQPVTPGK